MDSQGNAVLGSVSARMKEAPTGGTGLSAGERGARYRFWEVRGRWAMGRLLARADWSPMAFFHPFFCFFFFLFLFSIFFYIFCKMISKQLKPKLKFSRIQGNLLKQ
jgi:hypothetical protein